MQSTATITTANGSKYLQQLCKHWSHKLETEYDNERGRVNFGDAAVHFSAAAHHIIAVLAGPNAETLDRLEEVVARHLRRFAHRENLAIMWVRGA
jgi:hypothetical protein